MCDKKKDMERKLTDYGLIPKPQEDQEKQAEEEGITKYGVDESELEMEKTAGRMSADGITSSMYIPPQEYTITCSECNTQVKWVPEHKL